MESLNLKTKIIIGIAIVIAIVVIGLYFYKESKNDDTYDDTLAVTTENEEETEDEENEEITIHIIGEVKYPGIVILKSGQRIVDAIEAAGGETEEADLNKLNLAQLLNDGDKIYVPNKADEIEDYKDTTGKSSTVNLNTATLEELTSLPGIGESTAQKIIDYRKQNGKFKVIEDLKNVSGIGESKFDNIKDKITVRYFWLTNRIKGAILSIDIWGGMPMPKLLSLDENEIA